MRARAAVAGAVLTALCVVNAAAATRISYDKGGKIGPYLDAFLNLRKSGEKVIIDGPCLSACTIVLGIVPHDRICVTRRAQLGFHAAWNWDQPYLCGVGNSGSLGSGALMVSHPQGETWLSGGATGPEGSVLAFAAIAVALLLLMVGPGLPKGIERSKG